MATVTANFGAQEDAIQAYFREGEARALALHNRGPLILTTDGKLAPEIVDVYREYGFYILEGVIDSEELTDVRKAAHELMDRLPTERGSPVDAHGRPALGSEATTPVIQWSKPLGDPLGGTDQFDGRAPVKMIEPEAPRNLPKEVPLSFSSPPQFSEVMLRLAGHPGLLAATATINGEDFVPHADVLIIKKPGQGGSFAWHQDGTTHWDSPNWDRDIHGFHCMVQIYDCTAANAVWYIPGSHAKGLMDIRRLVEEAGGNCLKGAVPVICKAGDVVLSNRQIIHGSFPNTSNDWRVTFNLGYHRRSSVLGATALGFRKEPVTYSEEIIRKRCEIIGYGIAARSAYFPHEKPFVYQPHIASGEKFECGPNILEKLKNYQVNDLYI